MSKITMGLICVLIVLAMLPFALVARSRASHSPTLAPHLILDMDKQPKFKAQRPADMFADGRSMRPQVPHTLAQEDMVIPPEILNDPTDPHLLNGGKSVVLSDPTIYAAVCLGRNRPANTTDEQFAAELPLNVRNPKATDAEVDKDNFYVHTVPAEFPVTKEFIQRGQERFNIYCAPCHGYDGYGDGMVAQRADALKNGPDPLAASAWVQPQNLQEQKIKDRPDGSIFNTITNGVRTMPAYDKQITIPDRWAIVAYVRALERSQAAPVSDLTPEEQQKFAH
ncbi:MAG TPA: cytochrome c [Candidatus Saccharimonadales bacterium]|nr:cytochrome c [Candidatus Saccharimonadales bacterium]